MASEPGARLDAMAKAVIAAAIEVHRVLGPGFLEIIHELALCHELGLRGIRFARQVEIPVSYKGVHLGNDRLDLLVEDELIVELKAVTELADIHTAVCISYLKATGKKLALLLNFHRPLLKDGGIKRVVRS